MIWFGLHGNCRGNLFAASNLLEEVQQHVWGAEMLKERLLVDASWGGAATGEWKKTAESRVKFEKHFFFSFCFVWLHFSNSELSDTKSTSRTLQAPNKMRNCSVLHLNDPESCVSLPLERSLIEIFSFLTTFWSLLHVFWLICEPEANTHFTPDRKMWPTVWNYFQNKRSILANTFRSSSSQNTLTHTFLWTHTHSPTRMLSFSYCKWLP